MFLFVYFAFFVVVFILVIYEDSGPCTIEYKSKELSRNKSHGIKKNGCTIDKRKVLSILMLLI